MQFRCGFGARLRGERAARLRALGQFVAFAALSATTAPAAAFTIQSVATEGCHERVTREAWERAREMLPDVTARLPSSGDDEPLIADVAFDVPDSMSDIGGVTLLLGVRDNDVKQHGPNDLENLPLAASDPGLQEEHCLRATGDDEPGGSQRAVEGCRQFIRDTLLSSLDGLDAEGRPDPSKRDALRVSLAIRRQTDVSVPTFFLRAGRAVHALEDSFTHTFRNPEDLGKIRVVLNFVEYTQDTLDEAEDGPPHASELDQCDDADELRTERRELATEAASVAFLAVLDPSLNRAGKERAVDAMLDDYVAFDEGSECHADNQWCDAPELAYGSPTLGCQFSSRAPAGGGAALALLLGVAVALRRRRRLAVPLLALALLGLPAVAHAQSDPGAAPDANAPPVPSESGVAVPGKMDKVGSFLFRAATGAAYDHAAFSGGLGVRYQVFEKWMLGLDAEWNPYVAVAQSKVRSGSANVYLSVIRRYQLVRESVNIRTTVSAGASMLLFDLVGADKYSLGPFVGVSFLGVEWKVARGFYVTLDPTYIAIPVPNVVGVPFMYAQYRFLLGVELGG
jgi:MYXO-CTERM domain-containing protein